MLTAEQIRAIHEAAEKIGGQVWRDVMALLAEREELKRLVQDLLDRREHLSQDKGQRPPRE
jgi:hypothetical protein